MIGVIQA
jgi:hypothetical protein